MKRTLLLMLTAMLLAPQAWADDDESAGKKAERGIKKGAEAAGRGLKKGAEATGRGLSKAGNWIQKKAGSKDSKK